MSSNVRSLLAAYSPRCGSSLPAELSFNSLRTSERVTRAPSKVSNVQIQACQIKAVQSNFASEDPNAFQA
jgi:hypothetical protein